jgi:translation elongation factor Ts
LNAIGILVRIWFRFFVLVKVVYVLLCFEVGFFGFDTEAAQKDLRKRGKVLASKKSSRTAAEGMLAVAQNEGKVAVIELNCETDFVARNEIFQYLALAMAKHALLVESSSQQVSGVFPFGPELFEEFKLNLDHPKVNGETTVSNAVTEVAAIMGENVKFRRGFLMSKSSAGVLSAYLHTSPQPGLGRIAGIVSLEVEGENTQLEAIQRVGSELAMHVVAAKPLFLSKDLVSSEAMANEREILKSQAESTGKNQMAIEKIVEGRLRKYFEEVALMEQKFIVNDAINIKTLVDNLSKEVGSPVKVTDFLRVEVGEGIERLEASDEPVAQTA